LSEMCVLTYNEKESHINEFNLLASEENLTMDQFLSVHSTYCNQMTFEWTISIVVPIIFAIIVILGIVGNILVLVVVLVKHQMRNTTNVLIVNLAVSDLLFVIICIPPTALDYAIDWPLGDICCRIMQYIIHVTCCTSVLTLVYLSLDRYLAVVYPVRSISWRTVCNACVLIFLTWLVILTSCSPILFLFREHEFDYNGVRRLKCTFDRQEYSERLFYSLFFTSSLALPLMAILCFYLNMLIRLWRGSAATHGPGPMRDKNCKGKENKVRVTRMIIIVIAIFAVCWFPTQLILLLKAWDVYSNQSEFSLTFQIFAQCLAYCNSCINPILYAFFSTTYRAAFWEIISCGKKQTYNGGTNINGNATNGHRSVFEATLAKENTSFKSKSMNKSGNDDLNGSALELQPIMDNEALIHNRELCVPKSTSGHSNRTLITKTVLINASFEGHENGAHENSEEIIQRDLPESNGEFVHQVLATLH